MFSLYKIWPKLLSIETCEEIIECGKKIDMSKSTVSRDGNYDPKHRQSNICFIPKDNEDFTTVYKYVEKLIHDANSECFGVNLVRMQNLQFSEYHSDNEGHFDYHMDTFFDRNSLYQRKLTLCLQLSDAKSYEGGNFEFSNLDIGNDFKEQGSVLVFPSFLFHRVTPVTKGIRYSIVAWYEGLKWQ